ncbi:MAG: sulfurtransferase [Ottowia sp.]|nr:sulfurtransferase [Ottowia sp.]
MSTLTPLISAQALHALQDVLILDCRFDLTNPYAGEQAYRSGHIPHARYLDLEKELSGAKTGKNGRHPLPNPIHLSNTLRQLGLNKNTHVVAYDDQESIFAARTWWLLRWLGHSQVQVLDGGLSAWLQADYPLSLAVLPKPLGNFQEKQNSVPTVDTALVLNNLHHQTWQLLDARAPDRFQGKNETLDPVGGHIPGAYNRHFRNNLRANGCFKSAVQLYDEFTQQLTSTLPVIHQCGSGVSACQNLLAMEIAGLPSGVLYPGSWGEWCSDPQRPISLTSTDSISI